MVEYKTTLKLADPAGLVIGTMAVAYTTSKDIVDFSSKLNRVAELSESVEKNLELGVVVIGAMLKAFKS
ncbi:hypothetical protein Tco_0856926 [Tanacetum coccineum]|uniref:Uncharacterized protein n=1 Tax=Tanacetum coccineum TaxID=301880 RepID=A0ABQ5B928_9ASTR